MRFRILGPLEVWSSTEGWTPVSAPKWRSLLACLLLRSGQLVSTESLIFELWGDNPPVKANNLVSIYVHRLRRLIGDAEGRGLAHRAPGYLLRIEPGDLDLNEFESLVADGRSALAAADPERAATLLAEALGLWRGPLLADVRASALVTTESERTAELQLTATEMRIEADLWCGRSARLVPELRGLVAGNPPGGGLWLLLVGALDGARPHAEALDTYSQARQVISDELGVDPGAELQRLHARLLAADASSAPPRKRPPRIDRAARTRAAAGEPPHAAAVPDAGGADQEEPAADAGIAAGEVPGTISIGTFTEPASGPAGPALAEEPAGPSMPRPAQLPADIGDFTGRETHVRHLCDLLIQGQADRSPGAVRIAVVNGAAGLGKTTLAVHAAHQVRTL